MRIAADANMTKTRRMALSAIAVMGFGLLQGARFIDVNSGPYSAHSLALFGLFVDGATLLAIAVLSYFGKIDDNRKLYCAGAISCALYLALSLFNLGDAAIHQVFAGLTWSLNVLCWMEIFTNYKPSFALIMIALAYAVNAAVKPLLGALNLPVEGALAAFMAISIILLGICIRYDKAIAYSTLVTERAANDTTDCTTTTISEAFSRTRRAVACAFAFSFVCGFVIEADLLATGAEYAQSNETAFICLAAAILMVCALLAFSIQKANIDYMCPIAAAWIATALFARSTGLLEDSASGSIMTATLISFYVLLWLMLVSEAHERKLPAFFLLGLALGVARLSVMAGRACADWAIGGNLIVQGAVSAVSLWVLAIAVSTIFFAYLRYSSKRLRGGFSETQPEENERISANIEAIEPNQNASNVEPTSETIAQSSLEEDPSDIAFSMLAQRYALSEREAQIVREFAAGRSARYLAEWHMLSEHTIKTYMRRAYTKIGVHSRQELIDAIEEMRAESYKSAKEKA
ncbi:MAG: LuxR C-terminal-related transcriptional regulator [Slackia sp.]|nr:LuxR C-terminal-related transcriptional regulator [Slackia sp.]